MTRVGKVSLQHPDSVVVARTKMRRLATLLGMDDVTATRVSTATSQTVRWVREHDGRGVMLVDFDTTRGRDELVCSFQTAAPIAAPAFLGTFYDSIDQAGELIHARVRVDTDLTDQRLIDRATTIVSELSRDELLAEIRTKNEALEASKGILEQVVQERTAELAVALEQLENSELIIERWIPGVEGHVVALNAFALKLFGFREDEVVGMNGTRSFVPDDDVVHQQWIEAADRLMANPDGYDESELQCRKKDGTPVWVSYRNKAIRDADGNVSEVLSVGMDVTERRALEAQLQAANERMEGELNIGRDIQMSMLPQHFPAFPDRDDFSVYATLEPAREVGGDLFDFYLIDEAHLCFLVGDVSDKGVPAALFMAVTKTAIKSQALSNADAASILTHVNDELAENNESSMFVTAFVAILDTRNGEMTYTNAGHNPPYIRRADGSIVQLDDRHGPVAGALEGIAFGSSSISLGAGDNVILYTDGVTEAMDVDYNQYGDATLEALLEATPRHEPEELVAMVNEAVRAHRGAADQSDDITVLAMRFQGADPSAALLELTVRAELDSIAVVSERFEAFAQEHGLDDMVRRQVLLVLDDMLNNVASYAYLEVPTHPDEPNQIEVKAELTPARLILTISDSGVPFNPFGMNAPDIQASLDERDIGGLGIHLVKTVMDEVDYSRRAGRNVVTLIKRLAPEASSADTASEGDDPA